MDATDWTGQKYPKHHDTRLDHPGRVRNYGFSLCEARALYYVARAENLSDFLAYLNSSESPMGVSSGKD